jgi:hypothetical protein
MQKILIDGREFVLQYTVQMFDDGGITFHEAVSWGRLLLV